MKNAGASERGLKKPIIITAIILLSILAFLYLLIMVTNVISYFDGKNVKTRQIEYISSLRKKYESGDYIPVDEQSFCSFDLSKADEISYQQVRFLATHNSYKGKESKYSRIINGILASITDNGWESFAYYFDNLTAQLNSGLRSLEFDAYARRDGTFEGSHHPIMDKSGHAYELSLAFEELAMWSDNNPGHLPITILLEPKGWYIPLNGHDFEIPDYINMDNLIKEVFGDKLYTPKDMLGNYSDFEQMRLDNGWPSLEKLRGKFIFMLHPNKRMLKYFKLHPDMTTAAMFPAYDRRDVKLSKEQLKLTCFAISNFPLTDTE
ncbi:MAG: hypothetical protein K2I79_03890, partial [Clostridia bacterium]|nr:hypothetical protein [Clostridia bacterium]